MLPHGDRAGQRRRALVLLFLNAWYCVATDTLVLVCINVGFTALLVAVAIRSYKLRLCEGCGGRWMLRRTGEARDLTYYSPSERVQARGFDQEEEFRCKNCGDVVWKKTRKGGGG